MRQPLLAVLGGSLAAAHTLMNADDLWRLSERSSSHLALTERATQCGPAYNNQVCDAGQCCSSSGQCGTGSSYCTAPDCQFQWGPGCDANQTPPGVNTSSLSRPKFGNVPYGVVLSHCNTPGKVALTFDDGPYLYTADLLDLLKANNATATFFMVGNNQGKGQIELDSTPWPAIMRRVFNEGHQIASHTWSHQSLDALTPQQITDQVVKNEIAFSDVFGFFPTYIRPPYGFCSSATCQSILGNLGYHIIQWDVDTLDWQENYQNSRNIFSSAIQSSDPSRDSFLPLTHDVHYGTVHGFVQYMLDTLHAKGYTTALIGECMNDPKANWYRDASSGNQWSSSAAPAPTTSSTTTTAAPSSLAPTSTSTSTSTSTPTPTSTQQASTTSTVPATSSSSSTSTTSSSAPLSSSSPSSSSSQHVSTSSIIPSSSSHLLNSTSTTSASNATAHNGSLCNGLGACIIQGLGTTTSPTPVGKTTATPTLVAATPVVTGAGSRTSWHAAVLTLCAILLGLVNVS